MTTETVAEVLFQPETDELRFLPEGPTALGEGRFSWVAIQHGASATTGSLNIFDITTGNNQNFSLPGRPGFAKPTNRPGVFIVGCEREIGVFDTNSKEWRTVATGVDAEVQGTVINDGTVYGNNLLFGTKDLEFKTPKAGLYLYRGDDGQLIQLRNDQICSNGKDVIDRGKGGLALIDIDSPTKKVVRYPLDVHQGQLGEPETLIDLQDLPAVPDGMLLSPDEQSAIISFYNPNPAEFGETRQYSLYNGELEHIWKTPGSPQATCPALVGMPDGSIELVITTAVEHMPAERRHASPNAGALFRATTKFRSPPVSPQFPLSNN